MGRDEASGPSAVEGDAVGERDGEDFPDREPIADLKSYLRDDMTLAEFERAVAESTTILEIQQATRMPRWKVKRLLHHMGLRDDIASTAQRIAALRDDDDR